MPKISALTIITLLILSSYIMIPAHSQLPHFKNVEINGNKELQNFVERNNFSGSGTPSNPYIISDSFENLVLENTSARIIFEDCTFEFGHFNAINVGNIEIRDSSFYGEDFNIVNAENMKCENVYISGEDVFKDVHNLYMQNISSQYSSLIKFFNSRNIQLRKWNGTIDSEFYNVENLNISGMNLTRRYHMTLDNLSINATQGYNIMLEAVKNAALNNIKSAYLSIDNSENVHVSSLKMNINWNPPASMDVYKSTHVSIENANVSAISIDFIYTSQLRVSNSTFDGDISFKGINRVKIENVSINGDMEITNAENLQFVNARLQYSTSDYQPAIKLTRISNASLYNINISGPYKFGIYMNNTHSILITHTLISINYIEKTIGRYGEIYRHYASIGIYLENSDYITVKNTSFGNIQKVGIIILSSSHISILHNKFGLEIRNPIEVKGYSTYILLHHNIRGVRSHHIGLDITIVILLILILLILGLKRNTPRFLRRYPYNMKRIR